MNRRAASMSARNMTSTQLSIHWRIAARGVVVISSEMPELIGICDRIVVMHEGAFVGEVAGEEATQENIMRAIMQNKGKRP